VDKERGALPSRLHKHGQVLGRGTTRVIVQFDDEHTVVRIRPYLVRVLTTAKRSLIPPSDTVVWPTRYRWVRAGCR
jgi:hypothetical protein